MTSPGLDPFSETEHGRSQLQSLQAAMFKAVCDTTLLEVPSVSEFNALLDGGFADALNGVSAYSVNNCYTVIRANPAIVVGFKLYYLGAYGVDLLSEHLPGGARSCEVEERLGITPQALARALCTRDGRTVCAGCPPAHVPDCPGPGCGCPPGHVVHYPTPTEAEAADEDYVLPLVVGIRRYVYSTYAGAPADEVLDAAAAINDASYGSDDSRGCYAFNLVSEGALARKNGGPMELVAGGSGFAYVTRLCVPRVVGSRGSPGSPQCGDFILHGARKTIRRLVQGATEQIEVIAEEQVTAGKSGRVVKYLGHKAKERRHTTGGDDFVVATVWVSDTHRHGGSRKVERLATEVTASAGVLQEMRQRGLFPGVSSTTSYGMWVGATWLSSDVPLALLFMALGVADDRSLLELLGYHEAGQTVYQKGLAISVMASKRLLQETKWIPPELTTRDAARVFLVEYAYSRNRHQHVPRGNDRDVAAMLEFFEDVIVPVVLEGSHSHLQRIATLSWMAVRVVRCTREAVRAHEDPSYRPCFVPTDSHHWGYLRVYTLSQMLGQEVRKAGRRSLGTQVEQLGKAYEKAEWRIDDVRHAFKFGDGANGIRELFTKGVLQVGGRKIAGLAVSAGNTSPLHTFVGKYTLYKDGTRRSPIAMRAAHPTAYGIVCPVHTPEGENIGLVTHAASGMVTTPAPLPGTAVRDAVWASPHFVRFRDASPPPAPARTPPPAERRERVADILRAQNHGRPAGLEGLFALSRPGTYPVLLNGLVVGLTRNVRGLIGDVRAARRRDARLRWLSVAFCDGAVILQTSAGRAGQYMLVLDSTGCIPLPRPWPALLLGSFADLDYFTLERMLAFGAVEFVSALEGESVRLAVERDEPQRVALEGGVLVADGRPVTVAPDMPVFFGRGPAGDGADLWMITPATHMDMHPALILGVAAGVSGYSECNQGARGVIGSVHTVQAVGEPQETALTGAKYTTRKSRHAVDADLCTTKFNGYLPSPPGRSMQFVAIVSDAHCSEDAQVASHTSNDLDERAVMYETVQYRATVDGCRVPLFATDKPGREILAFPGQAGDLEQVRALRAAGRGDPGDFAGVLEDDDDPFEFALVEQLADGTSVQASLVRHKSVRYSTIGADGLPTECTPLMPGDAVIGRVTVCEAPTEDGGTTIWYRDTTITYDHQFPGSVKSVFISENSKGELVAVVNVLVHKRESIGDKFALPFGQKGVNSLLRGVGDELRVAWTHSMYRGLRVEREFGANGYSRMTVGMWRQLMVSHLAVHRGERIRGTFGECRWDDEDIAEIQRLLCSEVGISRYGHTPLRSAETGRLLGHESVEFAADGSRRTVHQPTMFTVGWIAVNAQGHWADRKINAVSRGPRDPKTRQPTRGSQRFGEMEVHALIAHGCGGALTERFSSDRFHMPVCSECGVASTFYPKTQTCLCPRCEREDTTVRVRIPFPAKLMFEEMASMGISTRLQFKDL